MSTLIPDYFSLFGLDARFALEAEQLQRAYRTVQSHVHPDRFAAAGAAEQRAALQWATLANEAYQVLKSPVRRAGYLCERNGVAVSGQSGGRVAPEFLDLQMQWRQRLEQARLHGDTQELLALLGEAAAQQQRELGSLAARLDVDHDFNGAAEGVRRLMFIDKFIQELESGGEAAVASAAD